MSSAQLFELDVELLSYVPPEERRAAARVSRLTVERVPPGPWHPASLGTPRWGFLIVDGMMAREVVVAGATAAELLGAGDVIMPPPSPGDALVPSEASWTVLETVRVAILDERYLAIARRWPQVTSGLLARAERRADRVAVTQAISHLTRVDTRVLTMLWLLADRWGRVTPSAIVLPLRLTHRTIARLIGARRPSVTTALSDLGRRGLVSRREDGSWALHGPPPEELERVGLGQISSAPAPAPRRLPVPAESDMQRVAEQVRHLATVYEQQQRSDRAAAREAPCQNADRGV
jgi:CRP-like cAMP-binding protein